MFPGMRQLRLKRIDLEAAFEAGFPEIHSYLDTVTGEVLVIWDDYLQELSLSLIHI